MQSQLNTRCYRKQPSVMISIKDLIEICFCNTFIFRYNVYSFIYIWHRDVRVCVPLDIRIAIILANCFVWVVMRKLRLHRQDQSRKRQRLRPEERWETSYTVGVAALC